MSFQFISKRSSEWLLFSAFILLICCLMVLFLSGLSFAEIYKWKNDDDTTGFTDNIGNVPPKYRDQVETKKYRSESPPKEDTNKETTKKPVVKQQRIPQEGDYQSQEKELSPGEKEELDEELQGIWNNMKDALGDKKKTEEKE